MAHRRPLSAALRAGHDWDRPQLWRRSMELLAPEVTPRFVQHAVATRARSAGPGCSKVAVGDSEVFATVVRAKVLYRPR